MNKATLTRRYNAATAEVDKTYEAVNKPAQAKEWLAIKPMIDSRDRAIAAIEREAKQKIALVMKHYEAEMKPHEREYERVVRGPRQRWANAHRALYDAYIAALDALDEKTL